MGYPSPLQIPLVGEATFRGICVYVPDRPEYARALLGSLAGLAQWVNWERDANQSASKSANLWKLANDLTIETWDSDCAMNCDDIIERIREIIREELDVQIINTNNLCCCGGCGNCGGQTQTDEPLPPGVDYPPMPEIPPTDDTPPEEVTENADYRQFSCNMSHYMFYLVRQSILAAVDGWHSTVFLRYQAVRDALGFSVRPGGGTADIDYWQYLLTVFNRESAIDAIRQMELNYDALICALSGSYTASVRRERFLAVIDSMAITGNQKRLVRFSMSAIEFQSWFNPADFETVQAMLPASYADRDCPCSAPGLPSVPSGYYLAKAEDGEWTSTPNNSSAEASYNPQLAEFTHYALDTALNYHEVDVRVLVDDVISRTNGMSAHGYVIEIVAEGDDTCQIALPTGTGGTVSANAIAGRAMVLYQNDEYANVPAYAAYIDAFDTGSKFNYGNGPQGNAVKNKWRSQSYGNTLTTFRYRVRVICKE